MKIPARYEYIEDVSCPKCHEESVYGDYEAEGEPDIDDEGKTVWVTVVHGEFMCDNCGHTWTK